MSWMGEAARARRAWWPQGRLGGALLAAFLGTLGLAACVQDPPRKDIVTASDQTDVDRRVRVYMELAGAYFERGNTTTALDEVKKVLAIKPDHTDAYNLRGLIYASMNEPELAEESFKRAMQLAPRDYNAAHNYGWFLCQRRRFAEADTVFGRLVAQPDYRDAPRSLLAQGVCQARDNRWADAEKTLSRAYELDPANPATAVNLAEVLYRAQQYERARFYIRRVNMVEELASAQTLWLAMRIENRLSQDAQVRILGMQLRNRFPDAPETLLYEKGRFDE